MQVMLSQFNTKINNPLEGYTIYTTGEPCPMCATVCVWAGISEIYLGLQFKTSLRQIIAMDLENQLTKGILREECLK